MPIDAITDVSASIDAQWRLGTLVSVENLTIDISEAVVEVPSWPGHSAGQYADVRLPGASRWERPHSYSIANAPSRGPATYIRFAVPRVALDDIPLQSTLYIDGPKGDRMAWRPGETDERPLLLIGGGTGIVPLLSVARAWAAQSHRGPLQLIYSVRSLNRRLYEATLDALAAEHDADVATIVTGDGPWPMQRGRGGGRLSALDLELFGLPPSAEPECFVCGPASFVESVTRMLVQTKHPATRIRTEWEVSLEDVG